MTLRDADLPHASAGERDPSPHDAPRGAAAFAWFAHRAESLLQPLTVRMQEGRSAFDLVGRVSSHGVVADRLEAFARPALLASLWLQSLRRQDTRREPVDIRVDPDRIASWLRTAIRLGTDPASPEYWGSLTNYHQHAVEMAILAMAIEEADADLWAPLDASTHKALATWLGQIRGHAGHANNHWFFDVLVLEFLRARGMGARGDDMLIAGMMDELECMYRGGGWFIDGCNETYDHYNAFSFHTYGLFWARRYGQRDPSRRERWLSMTHAFVESYATLFAASGEHVPIGRSLTYRFNAASVFPLAAALGVGNVPAGELRRLTRQSIAFFDGAANERAPMPLGWTDRFETFVEPYSCEASPYWASKAFFALTLDPSDPFFEDEERPVPSERGESTTVIAPPGWVVRQRDGDAEIVGAGVRCAPSAASRFGPWKWGRLSVRTGVGWLVPEDGEEYPADASLTASGPGLQRWFGRQVSYPIALTEDHAACVYGLGSAEAEFHINVRTSMWWKAGWILAVHHVKCWQPSMLRHGGFALPWIAGTTSMEQTEASVRVSSPELHSCLQIVAGFDHIDIDRREPGQARRHLTSDDHALAIARMGGVQRPIEGEHTCAVLFGTMRDEAEAAAWAIETTADGWDLHHPTLGAWSVSTDTQ
ncbi:MAG: DUF2264 domain-containing protein [Planctomycetota bacterium]